MEIVIGKAIQPVIHRNEFKIDVTFMEGDADGYQQEVFFVSAAAENHKNIKEFLRFLEACDVAYPQGKGGYEDYKHVRGYKKYCLFKDMETEESETFVEPDHMQFQFKWPGNDYDCFMSYDSYIITYFGDDGREFEVKIKK